MKAGAFQAGEREGAAICRGIEVESVLQVVVNVSLELRGEGRAVVWGYTRPWVWICSKKKNVRSNFKEMSHF